MLRSSGDHSIRPNTPQLQPVAKRTVTALASIIFGATALLTACGGGGGGSGATGATSSILTGTAATGAALANAPVTVSNSAGNSPCVETSITTNAFGSYTCTLKSGQSAPFFIVVTDPTGNAAPLVSVATATPTAGTPLTVNATPLTTAILAQLATDGNPLTLVATHAIVTADLQDVTAKVVAQLAGVLTSVSAPAGYNPFSTSITAATSTGTGNTADMILDVVKVVTDPTTGKLALSTVSDPNPIVLATTTTAGTTVAAPATGVSTLSQVAQSAAQSFAACFALPVSQRVSTSDTTIPPALGGPSITSTASQCEYITASTTNGAGINFRHNGYSAGQFFYDLMTSNAMTGAVFSVPEIMAFYPGDTSLATTAPAFYDRAVINMRYLDSAGNPGNKITVAARIPGTASSLRNSDWWLVGNQQTADVTLRLNVRRIEQLNTGTLNTSAPTSKFQTGIQLIVSTTGAGSTNLQIARLSGPGLPGNGATDTGLIYKRNTVSPASYMDLYGKSATAIAIGSTNTLACGNGATANCPNHWFSRTQGIAGTPATTLSTNPTSGTNVLFWSQPADGITPASFVKGAKYKVELYYGADIPTAAASTPVVEYKTLLSDLIPADKAVNLPWNTLGPVSINALNPAGTVTAAQTAMSVDWVQNQAAQQIGSFQAIVTLNTGTYGASIGVPKGSLSGTFNYAVPALDGTTTPTNSRTLLFGYRMLDGSNKTAVYSYN
jgi:hypothetical protein